MDEHAKAKEWPFTVYKDKNNVLADILDARYTPEVFVFDRTGTLAYHGRVDNSREPTKVTSRDAKAAFDAVLNGSPVQNSNAKGFGCTITRINAK